MKKVLGQTVRDLKRGVNKKVLKVHGVEQKILDATNNESWGPHGTDLAEIAQASRNYHECQLIMTVIWRRINDTGKNWRHVFKALIVLEYLVAHGSERVIDEIMEHGHQISSLAEFQYIDSSGRDQGTNVRRKSQSLVMLVNDKEKIREVRLKAQANRDKHGTPSTGEYSESVCSSTGGYDNNDEHSGNGTDDRNGYRDDSRYGKCRNSDEPYNRDAYGDDNYRGRGNGDGQFRSRSQSVDGCADSFGNDDHHSSRSGGKVDLSLDEMEIERNAEAHNVAAPPSYEDVARNSLDIIQDDRDEETVAASPSAFKPTSSSRAVQGAENAANSQTNLTDAFDEFDPRSVSAVQPSSPELDIFGFSASDSADPLALVPANLTASNMPSNLVFGAEFLAASSSPSPASSLPYEDPFGDAPFKAVPQENIQAHPQNMPQGSSFQFQSSSSMGGSETLPSAAQNAETFQSFHFGDTLGGLTFGSAAVNGQHASSGFPLDESSNDILDSIFPRTGSSPMFSSHEAQTAASAYPQTDQTNPFQSLGPAGPVVSHGESLTNTPTDQIHPFQPSTHAQTAQMNPFQSSGFSSSVASQELQTNTQHFFPPGLSAPASSQEPATKKQTVQMSSPKQSNPSLQDVSQGLSNNMQASQINFFQPSGLPAPAALQAPITKMQKAQTSSPQQSDESVPSASQGSPNITQSSQMNFFEPSGLSASQGPKTDLQTVQVSSPQQSGVSVPSASQGSPNTMQASQVSLFQPSGPLVSQEPTISLQTAQTSCPEQSIPPASQGSPTNMQTFQMSFFHPSGPPPPTSSQEPAPNMQPAQMNFPHSSGLSVPAASQGSQPTNMQTAQMNSFQPSGLSAPGFSQQRPQMNMQASHMYFFQPSASQGLHPNIQTGQLNFHPSASQGFNPTIQRGQLNFHPSALSTPAASQGSQIHIQMSQPNFHAPSGPPASAALQGLQTNVQTAQTSFIQSSRPAQSAASTNIQIADYGTGTPANNMQGAHLQANSQAMSSDPSTTQAGAPLARPTTKPQTSRFETKSTVWADTLHRGLVNLDISGPKTNPLADIGVDFDAINRKEKRLEPRSNAPPATSTIVMGKAMGSGSGRSAAGGLAPPNPMTAPGMGMGMQGMGIGGGGMRGGVGMGMGGVNMGMGMGGYGGIMNQPPMGMNMGMGMGMNMGMGQGAPMQPPGPGMSGGGYNPMMGSMGGYGSQRPYGGDYR